MSFDYIQVIVAYCQRRFAYSQIGCDAKERSWIIVNNPLNVVKESLRIVKDTLSMFKDPMHIVKDTVSMLKEYLHIANGMLCIVKDILSVVNGILNIVVNIQNHRLTTLFYVIKLEGLIVNHTYFIKDVEQ